MLQDMSILPLLRCIGAHVLGKPRTVCLSVSMSIVLCLCEHNCVPVYLYDSVLKDKISPPQNAASVCVYVCMCVCARVSVYCPYWFKLESIHLFPKSLKNDSMNWYFLQIWYTLAELVFLLSLLHKILFQANKYNERVFWTDHTDPLNQIILWLYHKVYAEYQMLLSSREFWQYFQRAQKALWLGFCWTLSYWQVGKCQFVFL